MKSETNQILARILEINAQLEACKGLYTEYDMLVMQLQADGFTGCTFQKFDVRLVDNFAESNTAFRTAGVKRYELKVKAVKP